MALDADDVIQDGPFVKVGKSCRGWQAAVQWDRLTPRATGNEPGTHADHLWVEFGFAMLLM